MIFISTLAFRLVGQTSVNMIWNCGWQKFNDCDALVWYVKKKQKSSSLLQVRISMQDMIRLQQLHRECKAFITKKTAHLRVYLCRTPGTGLQRNGKCVRWTILHHILDKWTLVRCKRTGPNAWPFTVRGSGVSVILWGAFCQVVHFQISIRSFTVNQYKVVLSHHLYPVIKLSIVMGVASLKITVP